MLSVVENQDAQRIYCGDRHQAIYEWRGAVNAMTSVEVEHTAWLTKSFRFGDRIAEQANVLLKALRSDKLLEGTEAISSEVGPVTRPDAVLCRTNGGTVAAVMRAHELKIPVAIVQGPGETIAFTKACQALQDNRATSHPELAPFRSWREVLDWVKENREAAGHIATLVDLVDRYGPPALIDALERCVDEPHADLVVSTAHRAKGRQWSKVKLGTDFLHIDDMDTAERRLMYVALTRAQHQLDISAWSAVPKRQPQGTRSIKTASTQGPAAQRARGPGPGRPPRQADNGLRERFQAWRSERRN